MTSPLLHPAWQTLTTLAANRRTGFPHTESAISSFTAAGIYFDFQRQAIDAPALAALTQLATEAKIEARRDALYAGALVNTTEARPALHTALRDPAGTSALGPEIAHQLARVKKFSDAVRRGALRGVSDQKFTDIVNIGIGGSLLGPELVCGALARFADGPRVHFLSNVDGAHLTDILKSLNPATTLFAVTSKTFTTDETNTNAHSAEAWLAAGVGGEPEVKAKHFVAITANVAEAKKQGYRDAQIFSFWDGVGGRFSLWSTVGIAIALSAGYENFQRLLDGAHAMDQHFATAPITQNAPIMLALIGVWNRNFCGIHAHAILPYAQRLSLLPRHLQQLEMESNGKSVDLDGKRITYPTCPVIFGEAGTNGQHSFHQLLHQGSDLISADVIMVAERESSLATHHQKLLAHALAQADAFWYGKSYDAVFTELTQLAASERTKMAEHRTHPGSRPVSVIALPMLDAFSLGALIALYEHKVFVQGIIWNVNSFDQWGVELGKVIAKSLLPSVIDPDAPAPTHLRELLHFLTHPTA